jgi:hypothetical protein
MVLEWKGRESCEYVLGWVWYSKAGSNTTEIVSQIEISFLF